MNTGYLMILRNYCSFLSDNDAVVVSENKSPYLSEIYTAIFPREMIK